MTHRSGRTFFHRGAYQRYESKIHKRKEKIPRGGGLAMRGRSDALMWGRESINSLSTTRKEGDWPGESLSKKGGLQEEKQKAEINGESISQGSKRPIVTKGHSDSS